MAFVNKFGSRSAAADMAKRRGIACFKIEKMEHASWRIDERTPTPAFNSAVAWAQGVDYVNHVELYDGNKPVLIVTCFKEEILQKPPYAIAPLTPSLWEAHAKDVKARQRTTVADVAPKHEKPRRERLHGQPTAKQILFEIADAHPEWTKGAVVAACVARGVFEGTASAQYSNWKKLRN